MLKNENFLKAVDVCKITRYQYMYSRLMLYTIFNTQYLHDGVSNERKDLLCFSLIILVFNMYTNCWVPNAFPFPMCNADVKI